MKKNLLAVVAMVVFACAPALSQRTGMGEAVFFDSTATNDAVRLTMTGVSIPASGKVFAAWLGADDDAEFLELGQLTVQGSGDVVLTYKDNSNNNLLEANKKFLITEETSPFSAASPSLSNIVFVDSLYGPGLPAPNSPLRRIRNCLVSFSNTKQGFGLAVWLKRQTAGLIEHTGFSRNGAQANNVSEATTHADHVFDFIRGQLSGFVGGNSSVAEAQGDPIGHGFRRFGDTGTHDSTQGGAGSLGGAGYHVGFVVNDPEATPVMKKEGASALAALRNAFGADNDSGWARELTDRAVKIMQGIYQSGALTTEGTPFYNLALKFVNGTVGETDTASATGGIVQAYLHIQRMASFQFDAPLQVSTVDRLPTLGVPDQFTLGQNYPNPFNGRTHIRFTVPSRSVIRITIYSIIGQEVARLVDGDELSPGEYSVNWESKNVVSGTYVYKLQATRIQGGGDYSESRQMVLIK